MVCKHLNHVNMLTSYTEILHFVVMGEVFAKTIASMSGRGRPSYKLGGVGTLHSSSSRALLFTVGGEPFLER